MMRYAHSLAVCLKAVHKCVSLLCFTSVCLCVGRWGQRVSTCVVDLSPTLLVVRLPLIPSSPAPLPCPYHTTGDYDELAMIPPVKLMSVVLQNCPGQVSRSVGHR